MKRGRAGGAPKAAAAVERVRVFIRLHRMLRGVRSLLVAVSGGPDSMVLLHLLASLAPSFGVTLRAAHLHHGLRGRDADRDLALVRRTCRSLGVPLLAGRSDVRARARRRGLSFETAAREARYAFLARCAARTRAEAVALGHTADDQAETFLLRLLRGAGARGLGGIRPVRFEGPLRIVRPLLCLWRREILSVAKAQGVSFRTDASNRNRLFLRNRVRHGLIPYLERQFNPRAREILIRAAELLAREHDFCETHAARRYRALAREEERRVVFPARRFAALPSALRAGLLRRALAALGTPGEVRFADAEAAARLCRVPGGGGAVCLPDGVVVSREYGELVIGRPPAAYPAYDYPLADGLEIPFPGGRLRFRVAVRARRGVGRVRRNTPGLAAAWGGNWNGWPLSALLSQEALEGEGLAVRTRRPGDRFRPLGAAGGRALKRVLIDEKLPARLRGAVPLLARGREIVWLPGHRIAERFKVTPATRRVLEVVLERAR